MSFFIFMSSNSKRANKNVRLSGFYVLELKQAKKIRLSVCTSVCPIRMYDNFLS